MKVLKEREHIARRFSAAAGDYRGFAHIQNDIARELVLKMGDVRGQRLVDVGAGDGLAARALMLAGADVVALDAAWGMAMAGQKNCSEAGWLQADACALPFAAARFDAVFSSSAYQWVDDLSAAFCEARRVLKPGGRLCAVMFGRETLEEFFTSLDAAAVSLGRTLPAFRRLPSFDEAREALAGAGFHEVQISVERRSVDFKDVKELLTWLKGIGANSLAKDFFWGKALLAQMEKEFKGRSAGFEIIWVEAKA